MTKLTNEWEIVNYPDKVEVLNKDELQYTYYSDDEKAQNQVARKLINQHKEKENEYNAAILRR